jgi:hypothetical protein
MPERRLPPPLKIIVNSSMERRCHGKADGKKKVVGKEKSDEIAN